MAAFRAGSFFKTACGKRKTRLSSAQKALQRMSQISLKSCVLLNLTHFAQNDVQIGEKALIFAVFCVFHREIRSVFHTFCVKKTSPSRMRRGSSPVKSTRVEGSPLLGPPSRMPSSCFCNSRASFPG